MKAHKQEGTNKMKDEARIVRVETVIEHIQYMLDRIDKRFDKIDSDLKEFKKEVSDKFDGMNNKFNEVRKEALGHFRWTLTFIIAVFASPVIANVYQYFHHLISGT